MVPGRQEVEPVDVSAADAVTDAGVETEAWSAESIRWVSDGGSISVFAEGSPVIQFTGDYTGPHFEILGRLGPDSTDPYLVRIVGKFWETDAVIHRAGETWHSHEGPLHDMGGICEDAGEPAFLVTGLAPVGNWEWPWLAVVERNGNAELVWEPSSSASGPDRRRSVSSSSSCRAGGIASSFSRTRC